MNKQDGFTLIELTVVICIIGIISAVIIPTSRMFERVRVMDAARTIKTDIRLTQNWAMHESQKYRMCFYTVDNRYKIIKARDTCLGSRKRVHLPTGVGIQEITFCHEQKEINFTKNGTPDGGGHIVLKSGRYQVKITILPTTGRVKIYPMNFME